MTKILIATLILFSITGALAQSYVTTCTKVITCPLAGGQCSFTDTCTGAQLIPTACNGSLNLGNGCAKPMLGGIP